MTLQVVPVKGEKPGYEIIDAAINVIKNAGIRYEVCPFETVMEGEYDQLMEILKKAQEKCFETGAHSILSNIKIEWHHDRDASIDEKITKYRGKSGDEIPV